MAKSFRVPMNMSVNWEWAGVWYTSSFSDGEKLKEAYYAAGGKHPHGPTHAEKISLIAKLAWDTCTDERGNVHLRSK